MGLNTIKGTGNWGGAASDLNNNFASITAEIEKLKAANVKFKGYYTTELTLEAAHPSPTVGDTAWVGETYPGVVYRCNVAGAWLATTGVPPSNTVNLSEYATQDAVSKEFASVRSELIISNEEDSYYEQIGGVIYASGVRGGSSNFKGYFFENNNFSSVEAYVGSANTNSGDAAIAFYSSSQIGSDSYLGGVAFNGVTGMAQYKADVPSDCRLIVVSNRYVDYPEYNVKFFATLKKIDERIKSIENVEYGVVQTTGTDPNVVMSQKAVTEELDKYSQEITELEGNMYGTPVEVANLSDSVTSKIGGILPTGERGFSSNYTNYYIRNEGYSKVSAFVGAVKNEIYLSIAFYNSDSILNDNAQYLPSFIRGVSFNGVQEQTTYESDIPNDCVIIVISNRTALFTEPSATIYKLQSGLKYQVENKIDKVNGKGLSTNDFTDNDKAILYGIENYDDVSVASGAGAAGTWAYSYKKFNEGQKLRIIMFTPTGITLPTGVATSQTCVYIYYQTTNGQSKSNLLYLQGYDYPIRQGLIKEGVITIEGGDTEYVRMYAKCQTTEKFGFTIQAIEDNAVNRCYAPSKMVHKFNALSFNSVNTSGMAGIYTFNFLHFSDIHKNEVELKRIKEFSKLYESYLCDVINTGDSVAGLGTEDFTWYAENGSKFLNVIGNHDTATSMSDISGWKGLGKQATYDKFIAPFIADWGVVYSEGNNYYYKDYVSSRNYGGEQKWVKLRLVVLDCMFYDEAQNTWLATTLSDANANGFDVMIAIHTSPAAVDIIPCTYTSIDASSVQYAGWASYSTSNAIQVVKNFIDNGGKFVCWLGGHVHHDIISKITEDNRQLVVLVETCSNNQALGFDRPYIEGEFEYADAFNIIGIDTYRHLIKIFKVGYEYDGAMRRKGTFVYDYENSTIVYNG